MNLVKSAWRTVVPEAIRSSESVARFKTRFLPHNAIYDQEYYTREVDKAARESAPAMASALIEVFDPRRVVDVGCGTGALASEMTARGVAVTGLEYADAAIKMCRERGVSVRKFDIESEAAPADLLGSDLAVSFEVAEHLPSDMADEYVSLLAATGRHIVISAAPPGQGGTDHVNEQPPEYWIEKFSGNGCDFDEVNTGFIRTAFEQSAEVATFYWKNTLVFTKR